MSVGPSHHSPIDFAQTQGTTPIGWHVWDVEDSSGDV